MLNQLSTDLQTDSQLLAGPLRSAPCFGAVHPLQRAARSSPTAPGHGGNGTARRWELQQPKMTNGIQSVAGSSWSMTFKICLMMFK